MKNWIQIYSDAIESGEIITSRRVRSVYKRLAESTKNSTGNYHFDIEKANRPIEFIEQFCRHSKGEWAGMPVQLELFQKAYVSALFGFVDANGIRQYRESFFLVGRKNGKSTLMSGIGLYMLTSDGEGGAEIYSTATKTAQAKLLFDEAVNMVNQSPVLSKHCRKRKFDLYYKPTMSKFMPLGANSNTLDGLNSSLAIMDELHAVRDRNLYEVMKQSQSARRQPLLIMITTAGTVRENIYDDMYELAAQIADGKTTDNHFLPVLYELDDRSEWTDSKSWVKANPALGTIKKVDDLTQKVERAKQNRNDLPGILTKEFNVRETSKTAWLSFEDCNNTESFDMEMFRGAYCIGGADLSRTTDLTCASLLFMKPNSDKKYVRQMFWIPEQNLADRVTEDKIPYDRWFDRGLVRLCKGNTINYSDVTAWFVEMVKEYDLQVVWVYYDSWSARYWVDEMEYSGFTMVRCIQGAKTLSLPMQMLGTDLQSHMVSYNDNPITRWCLTNTGVQYDRNGNQVPVKSQSPRQRIDGTAALLDCYCGLYEHMQEFTEAIK